MARIRVLLGCARFTKANLWRTLLSQEADIELVAETSDAIATLLEIGNSQADVAVIDLPPSGEDPGLVSHILEEYPRAKVIAVSGDGERAVKYEKGIIRREIPDASPENLGEVFRSLTVHTGPV